MTDDSKRLYPLRFIPQTEDRSWGRETYLVADLGFKDSEVENGWLGGNTLSELMATYLERVVGDDNFDYYGLQFPVMVKQMDVEGLQPLRVNPSDIPAEERYDTYGKKVLWYIEEAKPDSRIWLGFKRNLTAAEFYTRCLDGTLEEVLNVVHPRKGDSYLIEPGTVHAAGPGLSILEVSECSELSFTLYNWGKESQGQERTELEEAFDLIDFGAFSPTDAAVREKVSGLEASAPGSTALAVCPEFIATKILLRDPLRIKSEVPGSFALYFCLSGEASVLPEPGDLDQAESCILKQGMAVVVPSELNDFVVAPNRGATVLVEVMVEKRLLDDSYTSEKVGPSAGLGPIPDPQARDYD